MSAHPKKQLKPCSPIFIVHIPLKLSDGSNQTCSSRSSRKDREDIRIIIETGDSTKIVLQKS